MSGFNPPEIGTLLQGRYELLSVLGEGGFGIVYKARQRPTGQIVAVKLLQPEKLLMAQQAELEQARFEREMLLISLLKHPNIVRLIDSGRLENGHLFTVLEYVEGESLSELLKRGGPLPLKTARRLMLQVLEALHFAHALGVVHRDLKPANIMVSVTGGRPNAMVLDYGIANLTEDARGGDYHTLTATGQIHGTPSYMAPEQLDGELTPQSDLYAWGLVFIECLTGKPAVDGTSIAKIIFQQLSSDPVDIPQSLKETVIGELLTRTVEKDLSDRFPSAERILAEFEGHNPHSLELRAVGANAPTVIAEPERANRRGRWIALGVTAVVVVAALSLWGLGRTEREKKAALQTSNTNKRCPNGQHTSPSTHGQCCWSGQAWNGSRCVGAPSGCPAGFRINLEAEVCSPQPCYGARVRTPDLHCCWPQQGWDQTLNACIGRPRCPEPYLQEGDRCVFIDPQSWPLHQRCEAGEAVACTALAQRLLGGLTDAQTPNDTHYDRPLAASLLQRACEAGDPEGCVWLGLLVGPMSHSDSDRAARLFRDACDHGAADGCFNLAWSYLDGEGVEFDVGKARQLLLKTCELKHARACTVFGQFTEYGWSQDVPDKDGAQKFYLKACKIGDPYGCFRYGIKQLDERFPVKGLELFERACRAHDPAVCKQIGALLPR